MDTSLSLKRELHEWEEVNSNLRKHGLSQVVLIDPTDTADETDSLHVLADTSKHLRKNLDSLMQDCDRRQALIQDLILTNNQLKQDLEKQTQLTQQYESTTRDLRVLLESSRDQVKELQSEHHVNVSQLQEEEEKLRNTKSALHTKYSKLRQRCIQQEDEIQMLQQRVLKMNDEDEKRLLRQNEIFQQFKKRASKAHSSTDDRMLDIIDSYERQIGVLKKEIHVLRMDRKNQRSVSPSHHDNRLDDAVTWDNSVATEGPSQNYKAILKSYEKQLKDTKRRLTELEDEREVRQLELQARPELKDFRAAQQRIKKLEVILKKNRIRETDTNIKDKNADGPKYSTAVEDLEFLPITLTRKYLRQVCDELCVVDLEKLAGKAQSMTKAAEGFPRLKTLTKQILDILNSPDLPPVPGNEQTTGVKRSHELWCDKTSQSVIITLEHWLDQLLAIKELQTGLDSLVQVLMPWRDRRITGEPDARRLVQIVDTLLKEESQAQKTKSGASAVVLAGIVEHFQQLFDVHKVSGVYPRMNEIYTQLGESSNVLHTLRDLLGLDERAKGAAVVEAVGTLCQAHNTSMEGQLKKQLQVDDLHLVIQKLHEHEEFLPVFRLIIQDLMDVLGVHQLDQVVPATKALKVLATTAS